MGPGTRDRGDQGLGIEKTRVRDKLDQGLGIEGTRD
jgi:hypothetical protein